MKLVLMSSCGVQGSYFVRRIQSRWPDASLIRVLPSNPKRKTLAQRLFTRKALDNAARRLILKPWWTRIERQVETLLAEGAFLPDLQPAFEVPARELNTEATAECIRDLNPDLLITCCAPIIKPLIYTIPRWGTLNVHFGISPYYRGEHTLFWPSYFRDYRNLGVTLHHIDAGIDTGPIVVRGWVDVEPTDTEATLSAKATKLSTELAEEILQNPQCLEAAAPTMSRGRNFNSRDRKIHHELVFLMRRLLGERPPVLAERREFAPLPDGPGEYKTAILDATA